ncbi:MAG TPA: aspartate--tRNA(Asn) ligase [Clostridiaceae bacterium]
MKRTYIKEIKEAIDEELFLKGWVHKISDLGQLTFIMLRDKTGIIQLVLEKGTAEHLRLEMSVEVTGTRVFNEKAPGNPKGVELHVSGLKILGKAYYDTLPFSINQREIKASLEAQLDYRTISLRSPKLRAVFKVQEEIIEAFRNFLRGNDFSEINTPKIIATGTEGGSEMFTVNYFDRRAFLTQSPQFYKQMMVGAGFERVYEVGHAYRAELHNTWRHLNEYVSLDLEMGFIQDETDLMDLEEEYLRFLFKHLEESCSSELAMYNVELPSELNIPRIPLSKAQEILLDKFGKRSPTGNIDAEGEILFSKYIKETYSCDFVFLTEYPIPKRPMYAMPDENHLGMTRSFDLIYKGLEITTGGQRIHDYDMFKENIKMFGLNPEDFGFYLDSFKYGMPPHGGLAIGLERITLKILNLKNIREATLIPRDIKRMEP